MTLVTAVTKPFMRGVLLTSSKHLIVPSGITKNESQTS